MHTQQHNMKGFTLVETLIAIAVLMISIAGPLVVASKGLNSALFARDQMMANLLAQETLEFIKNTRDNNVGGANPRDWLDIDNGADNLASCTENATCDFSADDRGIQSCGAASSGGCRLYYSMNNGYNSNDIGDESIFRRYFYFTDVSEASDPVNEKRLTVVVGWNHGVLENEIVLKSVLVDAKR